MRTNLLFLSCLIFLIACENKIINNEKNISGKKFSLYDLKDDFKFKNLTEFEIDSCIWDSKLGKYKELDSLTFYNIWQNYKSKSVGQNKDNNIYYMFSWQENRDTNFIELTILTLEDSDNCSNVTYFIFDKKGKLIDKFVTNSSCGDAGYTFVSFGRFINKSTFEKLCVESDLVGLDTIEKKEIYEGDSTLYQYIISKNGRITEKLISKKHFIEKL